MWKSVKERDMFINGILGTEADISVVKDSGPKR